VPTSQDPRGPEFADSRQTDTEANQPANTGLSPSELYDPHTDGHRVDHFVVPEPTTNGSVPEPIAEPADRESQPETAAPDQPEALLPEPALVPEPKKPENPGPELGPTGRPWPDLGEPPAVVPGSPAMIIAMCNQKGGVGKTTTTINLGAALVELGRKVLLVDFDPQGSLSVGLGVNPHNLELSIYNLLLTRDTDVDEVIEPTTVEGLDILPSNIDLSAAELQLVSEVAREQTLLRVLEKVRDRYDVILIDCAPSLGLLTINALTAADRVLVPLECEFFALRGVALLTDTIEKVQERLNPKLEMLGILGTMYDPRTLHSREVLERVVQAFGDVVFHTVIRRTIKFPETTVAGEPITTYASDSPGASAYRMLAREVLDRCLVG
jgi:chromosome partitioning protein